jgi:hypothetical protein
VTIKKPKVIISFPHIPQDNLVSLADTITVRVILVFNIITLSRKRYYDNFTSYRTSSDQIDDLIEKGKKVLNG